MGCLIGKQRNNNINMLFGINGPLYLPVSQLCVWIQFEYSKNILHDMAFEMSYSY